MYEDCVERKGEKIDVTAEMARAQYFAQWKNLLALFEA
jgi:hypothetical protein